MHLGCRPVSSGTAVTMQKQNNYRTDITTNNKANLRVYSDSSICVCSKGIRHDSINLFGGICR